MINQVTSNQYGIAGTTKTSNQSAAQKTTNSSQADQSSKIDTVEIGTKQESSVTYTKVTSNKKLDAPEIAALKEEADKATENLRKLVEELILKQDKNYKASTEDTSEGTLAPLEITTEDVQAAQAAISEDGEFGVKAVSDRLVDFAISVSGGDKSKLNELISAIDEGFAAAKKALGGELPDISQQTYDETMRKLNDWAKGIDE